MKAHTWILIGTLLALPVSGFAQAQPTVKPAPPANTSSAQTNTPKATPPVFDLKDAAVQSLIRNSAVTASDGFRLMSATAQPQPEETRPAVTRPELQYIPFRAPLLPHHMDCDSFNCVAYTADEKALYSIPRDQYVRVFNEDSPDTWLSCQSGNDLLTTFERYDKCRGVSIGLPLQGHDVIVDLPELRL